MRKKTISAVVEGVEKISLQEFDIPEIGPDEGLLKVEMVGVCGTDVKIFQGKIKNYQFPVILGHEILGKIDKLGEKASKQYGLKEGDRVIVESSIRCNQCYYCLTGYPNLCDQRRSYGTTVSSKIPPHLWGAYGQYMYLAPNSQIHKISEDVPAEAGVLVCAVLANNIRWISISGGITIGDTVVVQGVGQQGLAAIIAAREFGASTIIAIGMTIDENRFKLAKEFGADYTLDLQKEDVVERVKQITGGKMADVVVEVSGNYMALLTSIELVKKMGTIVYGSQVGTDLRTPLPMDKIIFKEIKLKGGFTHNMQYVLPAIKLVESRKYAIEKMVTHRFPLKDAELAIRTVAGEIKGDYPTKVVMIP